MVQSTNYYSANNTETYLYSSPSYIVTGNPGFPQYSNKNWKIFQWSGGAYPDTTFGPGDPMPTSDGAYYLYPVSDATICFKQDTKILCQIDGIDQYIPVQTIKKGTLVKTLKNNYVPVDIIGSSKVYNSGNNDRILNRLYRLPKSNYPTLKEDLIMTGGHCSLIDIVPTYELRQKLIEKQGNLFTTDGKYRLPALLNEKAIPYEEEGMFTIWNFALENKNHNSNYGIYANGLLVESGFHKSILTNLSNTTGGHL